MTVLVEKASQTTNIIFICIVSSVLLYYASGKNTLSKIQYFLSHSQYTVENTGLSESFTYLGRVVLFLSVCISLNEPACPQPA